MWGWKSKVAPRTAGHDPAVMPQGSSAWRKARLGHVTASRIADVMARSRHGYGGVRESYLHELIAERRTGRAAKRYTNAAMRWGSTMEPKAVAAYQALVGVSPEVVGFLKHPQIPFAGASPDRLVGADGLLEVKCPSAVKHLETLVAREIERKYLLQMQWQMACSGREWCDFLSYDPRQSVPYMCFVARIARDDNLIAQLEDAVRLFLAELDYLMDQDNAE